MALQVCNRADRHKLFTDTGRYRMSPEIMLQVLRPLPEQQARPTSKVQLTQLSTTDLTLHQILNLLSLVPDFSGFLQTTSYRRLAIPSTIHSQSPSVPRACSVRPSTALQILHLDGRVSSFQLRSVHSYVALQPSPCDRLSL